MAKLKTLYFCQSCGSQYSQWHGQCKNCGDWNTLVEEVVEKTTSKSILGGPKKKNLINKEFRGNKLGTTLLRSTDSVAFSYIDINQSLNHSFRDIF